MLAVRGDFGDGKSAFLRMCVAHLRNQETPVVEFNAWLQGHTEDPLRDLISVLSNDLDRPQGSTGLTAQNSYARYRQSHRWAGGTGGL